MPAVYDTIGLTYRATRAAEPRIVQHIVDLLALPSGAHSCDVGAGSGNYTNALAARGFKIIAVEPSAVMRGQVVAHPGVTWREGFAEHLPLADNYVDGVVCTLAAHHFKDLAAAATEMARVCATGPLVFFTKDPRTVGRIWFEDYFPEIRKGDYVLFPALDEFVPLFEHVTGRAGEVHAFPLPCDLVDNFMLAPWSRPEAYLDPVFRANTSGFAFADPEIVKRGVAKLADDLASGAWDARYGHLRRSATYDAGYRFVAFRRT